MQKCFFLSSITHSEPQLFEPCLFFQRKEYLKEKWRHRSVWNTPEGVQQDQLAKGNRARQSKRITGSLKQILSLQPMAAAPGLKIPSSHQGHAVTHFRCISICFRPKLKSRNDSQMQRGQEHQSFEMPPCSCRARSHQQQGNVTPPAAGASSTGWGVIVNKMGLNTNTASLTQQLS